MMKREKFLKSLLFLGGIYFFIAGLAHFFGWTIFPFYDGKLYSQYHDTLIALSDLVFFMLFLVVGKNPKKNIDTLNIIIAGLIFAVIFNIGIIWKIDFESLGSSEKKFQTITETVLATILAISLFALKQEKK